MGRDIQTPGELENVVRGQDDLDPAATGGEAADPGMTAKLDPAVEGQLLGEDIGGVVILAKERLSFDMQIVLTHSITLSIMIADRRSGKLWYFENPLY
jgi:hypothetical protein